MAEKPSPHPAFTRYARTYRDIERDFEEQVASFGLPFAPAKDKHLRTERLARLEARGVEVSNDGKSLHTGWLSPACVRCRKGLGTATFLLSVQCPKSCYFCFNPNQLDYERLLTETNDVIAELDDLLDRGAKLDDVALTGGEPLVHKQETLEFFHHARRVCPDPYLRLYTSGAFLDEDALKGLAAARLDEIRFSIKLDDPATAQRALIEKIAHSKNFIPQVLVEMPVMPDQTPQMKELLHLLDEANVTSINLLELCYPLHNAQEFAKRGYAVKRSPYRVLYDYWYAGGLPIDGSEEACLELLEFATDAGLHMGVHYCSLENKFTGQVFLQNNPYRSAFPVYRMSDRDHFLKTARVFGSDVEPATRILERAGATWEASEEDACLAFSPDCVELLASELPDITVGICSAIVEPGDDGVCLRELKMDPVTPRTFESSTDL